MNFLLLDEIFPSKVVCGVMGLPQTGKTLYALEQLYHVLSKENGNALYISTEEPSPFFVETWKSIFEKKYNIQPKIIFKYYPFIDKLLNFVGVKGKVVLGGKNEFVIEEIDIAKSDFLKIIKEQNIKYVVIDSVTTTVNPLMQGGRQNLPLRSGVEEILFSSFSTSLDLYPSNIYFSQQIISHSIPLHHSNHVKIYCIRVGKS